ncbi:MAG: LrgB family protein [Negativicutes bacterium]|nr:LrgB family protein [Negativicutes bacterium]
MAENLFWLFATCAIYAAWERVWLGRGRPLWLVPPLATMVTVVLVLLAGRVDYQRYFQATQPITFLLMPATVALALPIFQQWRRLRVVWRPVVGLVVWGALISSLTASIITVVLGAERTVVVAATIKSITTPIALAEAERFGGDPAIVAVVVFLVGMIGGITAPLVLNVCQIRRPLLRGLVYGITAHGLGTAMAMLEDEECGAFAGLAMGLCGIVTALFVPLLIGWLAL